MLRLKKFIFRSPGLKVGISTVITILIGVFSGSLVTEITIGNEIVWLMFYRVFSFYALLALLLILVWYERFIYIFETDITQFGDPEFCEAYLRSQMLPELAERSRQLIRDGQTQELVVATRAVIDLLRITQ